MESLKTSGSAQSSKQPEDHSSSMQREHSKPILNTPPKYVAIAMEITVVGMSRAFINTLTTVRGLKCP
jgi:hypothetical protein